MAEVGKRKARRVKLRSARRDAHTPFFLQLNVYKEEEGKEEGVDPHPDSTRKKANS